MCIDWNEAPEWAAGHGEVTCITTKKIWFNELVYMYVGDSRSYQWCGADPELVHNHGRRSVTNVTMRPTPWTGKGLPPVGTVCVAFHPSRKEWLKVKVLDRQVASECYACRDDKDYLWWSTKFRPIRTPEQIAAEEIQDIESWLDANIEELGSIAKTLHEAGFRK